MNVNYFLHNYLYILVVYYNISGKIIIIQRSVNVMTEITNNTVQNYKLHLLNEEKSPATVAKYLHDISAFRIWLGSRSLSKAAVLEYKDYLTLNYAPASVNAALSSLNSFFEFADCHSLKVKTLKIQRRVFARREKELSKAEYERLLTAAKAKGNRRLYLLMQTICACGIRVSELRYITVGALHSGRADINLKGKLRTVILPRALCKLLKKYIAEQNIKSGSVFITKSGRPIDRSNIWKMMKSLCKLANVSCEKVFPHNLRHLFARAFYAMEKDLSRLSDILGHSSINTTRIYTAESGSVHAAQMERLGLVVT